MYGGYDTELNLPVKWIYCVAMALNYYTSDVTLFLILNLVSVLYRVLL